MRIPRLWLEGTPTRPHLPYGALPAGTAPPQGAKRIHFEPKDRTAGHQPARYAERTVRAEAPRETGENGGPDSALEKPRLVLPGHVSHRAAGRLDPARRGGQGGDRHLGDLLSEDVGDRAAPVLCGAIAEDPERMAAGDDPEVSKLVPRADQGAIPP